MFCPNCGNEIPDGAKFCAKCGHQISPRPAQAGAQTTGPQAFGTQATVPTGARPANHNKKPLVIGIVAVVAVIAVVAVVAIARGGGIGGILGGVHWYEPASFLGADASGQLKSLQDSGFECDDDGQWTCEAEDGPYKGSDVAIVAGEDSSGDFLDEDAFEDGDAARIMIIRCTSVDLGDVSSAKEAMEKAVDDFNLGTAEDTQSENAYAESWGKCKIDGEDGLWILAAIEGDDDDWSVQIYASTIEASGYDSYDDLDL